MKNRAAILGALAMVATSIDVSRGHPGPSKQELDSAKALSKKKRVREEIRARRASAKGKP